MLIPSAFQQKNYLLEYENIQIYMLELEYRT